MTTFCECVCVCGVLIYVKPRDLKLGIVRSCGCLNKDTQRRRLTEINKTHGCASRGAATAEYRAWAGMKARCSDPRPKIHRSYGGRGIRVCERWKTFENFLCDMGRKPSSEYTLERIDNNGIYEPGNCRWATDHDQNRNRRSNRMFTIKGETLCMTDWAKRYGQIYKVVHNRIDRYRWSIEEALGIIPRAKGGR